MCGVLIPELTALSSMVFSSPIFLFLFLPVVLTLYFVLRGTRLRNLWLLAMSIVFYAWGEIVFVFLMMASTVVNYVFGLWLDATARPDRRKWVVGLGVAFNLGLLGFFKYAGFLVGSINAFLGEFKLGLIHFGGVRLPIGISFFTFHALSYLIDVYRRKSPAAKNPLDVALYIFFFPQLIAGPILRWSAMAPQFGRRVVTRDGFADGVRRFIYGLAKKMLVADAVAVPAGQIFSLQSGVLSMPLAWFGALCYTLQIYYDFSGYSDMAIGMGKMFGFDFAENFNYPYVAQSIREFWRRWHITLSTWFRDYLYFPLGGNRCSSGRVGLNLLIVFFLCGLWHGAAWTFVIWGLYHGLFLILERSRFGSFLASLPEFFRHVYALIVVMMGWVLFRADSFPQAVAMLRAMFGLARGNVTDQMVNMILTHQVICVVIVGIFFSAPIVPWFKKELLRMLPGRLHPATLMAGIVFEPIVLIALFIVSSAWLAGGTYNPFIYFRF